MITKFHFAEALIGCQNTKELAKWHDLLVHGHKLEVIQQPPWNSMYFIADVALDMNTN